MANSFSILIVDDNPQLGEIFTRRLSHAGHLTSCAESGEAGLALLARRPFDLLLLDIMMPGMSGIVMLREIRRSYPDLAVIMVTAEDNPEVAKEAINLGIDGYLVKPVLENELLISVSRVLRLQLLERENREYREHLEEQVARRTADLEKAMTDLKSYQDQLIQQEKLATIGHLAAGVAHEIKSPTGYIGSNLGSMKKHFDKISEFIAVQDRAIQDLLPEKRTELIEARKRLKIDLVLADVEDIIVESLEGVEKIKKIVEGLKSFSRKEQETVRAADINECLENALTVAWNELKYKATVEKHYGDLPPVECFQNQLGQVFMNLLVNGAHAIEKQGLITIDSRQDGDFVIVSISDNGHGIPKSIQHKIFEPFFTTKELGVGTGLGLSIIKEIVAKHHGEIHFESEEGKGSIFTVRIPLKQQCRTT